MSINVTAIVVINVSNWLIINILYLHMSKKCIIFDDG